jgi:hypothetical protein
MYFVNYALVRFVEMKVSTHNLEIAYSYRNFCMIGLCQWRRADRGPRPVADVTDDKSE